MTGNLILLGINYRVTEQEHTIQIWNNQNCDETGGQRLQAFDSSTQNLPCENVQEFGSSQCHYMEVLLYLHKNTPGYTYFSLVHENSLTVITEIINSRWGYCIVICDTGHGCFLTSRHHNRLGYSCQSSIIC
jgi:hypothetical protein